MTNKKKKSGYPQSSELGKKIYEYRQALDLPASGRQSFIDDRVKKGLLPNEWLSEKSLINIELGYKLPSLITLRYLAIALEIPFKQLCSEIEPYIPERRRFKNDRNDRMR